MIQEPSHTTDGDDVNITPRKTAEYLSPRSKPRSRQRKTLPNKWKKNVRKQLRLTGKEYVSSRGKTISCRRMKRQNCSNCRFKCASKITEEERQTTFDLVCALDSYKRNRTCVCQNVLEKECAGQSKRRKVAHQFTLTCNGLHHRICKHFFLVTLCIGEIMVYYDLANQEH